MTFIATIHTPGYLPDSEPAEFDTAREAWQYLVSEVDRFWDECADDESGGCIDAHSQMNTQDQNSPGEIYAATPGPERIHDLGIVYSVTEV